MNRLFDFLRNRLWTKQRKLAPAFLVCLLWDVSLQAQSLACNDLVHVSLDTNCTATITAGMLLEDMQGLPADYTITLFNPDDSPQPDLLVNQLDVGNTYQFSILHNSSGNSCWGKIKVEEKYPPNILCENDTVRCGDDITPWSLGFPIPSWFTPFILTNTSHPRSFYVFNWDACGVVYLKYNDMSVLDNCADPYFKKITRTWEATDVNGNTSTCEQLICIHTPSEVDIVPPLSFDGFDYDPIPCDYPYPKLPNGNPSPNYTGWPVPASCSTLNAAYTDVRIQVCSGTFKVVRKWTVLNWCTQRISEFYQIIKVLDDQYPDLVCPDDFSIGMDPYSCTGTVKLTGPISVEDCSNYTWEPFVRLYEGGDLVKDYIYYDKAEKCYYLKGAREGRIWVTYVVTDDCGNVSECRVEIGIFDDIPPTPVCDQKTVVTLGIDGTAKIYAESFDDGSIDNCKIDYFLTRRMDDSCRNNTDEFGPYVEFCCKDVALTKMVALEVTDASGNKNTCMVEVTVQEKEPPHIEAPSDITVTCGFDIYNHDQFGKIVYNELDREEIIIRDPFYSSTGFVAGIDGYAYDNCHVTVTERVEKYLVCGLGYILRIFTATDRQGHTTTDVQTITVINPNPIDREDIRFPRDTTIYSCSNVETHPDVTGRPIPDPRKVACAQIAAQYDDLRLVVLDSVCYKILRKWTVIDWCQYNVNSSLGFWEGTQIIYVKNSEPPTLETCFDTTFCDQTAFYDTRSSTCFGSYRLRGQATDDCTKPIDLHWQYRIDYNNDGSYDTLRTGSNLATGVLPLGTHRLRWYVTDQCGNNSVCDQVFTIKDCKKPTPYCANGIVTVLMQTNGSVAVWASDLNLNSFDNCTQAHNLVYSFSADTSDKSITFTCDSLKGERIIERRVRIYVTDEAGNQDYCETFIRIQDNGVCRPTGNFNLTGSVTRDNQSKVTGVNIEIDNELGETISKTEVDDQGNYAFLQIPSGNYTIRASKNDNITNGISTLDILLIQKHILNQKPITSPYTLIAADVNSSKSITAKDMADLRKVILGTSTQFDRTAIWQFVPAYHVFNDPAKPWDAPKYMDTKFLEDVFDKSDWKAIKTGDIDLSAIADGSRGIYSRSNQAIYLVFENKQTEDGMTRIAVKSMSDFEMEGMQFSMQLPLVSDLQLRPAKCDISKDQYLIKGNQFRLSYTHNEVISIQANDILFYLEWQGNTESSQAIPEFSELLNNEVYLSNGQIAYMEKIDQVTESNQALQVYSPRPNPFKSICIIPMELPADTDLTIRLLDHTGKLIHTLTQHAGQGIYQCELQRNMFGSNGLYYIMVESKYGNASLKVMLID